MAQVDAAAFKAAIGTAAADITTAWSDTVKTEFAATLKNPMHPLRMLERLFTLNAVTGVVAANDGYIDAAYGGAFPSVPEVFGSLGAEAMNLLSATVENAAPSDVVLTFDTNIHGYKDGKLAGTVTTAKNISAIVVSGAVMTITVDTPYINGDAPVFSGWFYGNQLDNIDLTGEVITNNVV